ncbi:MAG TPA: RagB/SusD family nutrient uptake outer membrane protein [Chitinophagaceae bacterium]|nr:RagB/SusD family nutrient uptake outer membrane protein [Chitinophagaceae bacterium]
MKNLYKLLSLSAIVIIGIIVLESCKKDWLTPKLLSNFSADYTYVDVVGFNAALNGCARTLKNEWYGDGAPIITETIFSEIAVEGTDDKTGPAQNLDVLIKPDANLNSVDNNRIGWYWEQEWIGIRLANTIISRLPAATAIADATKNIIKGKAYFYRAYDYYRLTNQFGDVPCPLKELTSVKTDYASVKREVILQRMKRDLDSAVLWVPWTSDRGDVNRGAIYHLLAKIDLALGLFDDAIAAASAVINNGTYKLMTARFGVDAGIATKNVTWDLHRPANKAAATNTEVLFLVTDAFGNAGRFVGGIQSMRQAAPGISIAGIRTPNGGTGISPLAGVEIDNMQLYGRGIGRCRSTSYHYKEIWDDVNDLRHDSTSGNWMYMENLRYSNPDLKKPPADPYYGQRLRLYSATGALLCSDTLRQWYPWPHYKIYIPDVENTPMRGGNTDWYVMRLAETYLIRAEAYVWKGDLANAAADVNKVRQRAGCAAYTAANMSIGTILDERARELYYEEGRKTELTRIAYLFAKTGQPYNGKTYTLTNFSTSNFMVDRILEKNVFYAKNFVTIHQDVFRISQYHVLWPIPQSAILANTEGRINQNIGYSGAESNVPPLDVIPE